MGFGLGDIFGGGIGAALGIGSSILGMADASAQRKRAEAALQAALTSAQMKMDTALSQQRQLNAENLYAATGLGGDAVRNLGGNLGSALAGAGVYNSTGVAGALARGASDVESNLRGMALGQQQNLLSQESSNQRYLTGLQVGALQGNLNNALGQESQARAGFGSMIGGLPKLFPASSPINGGGGYDAGAGIGGALGGVAGAFGDLGRSAQEQAGVGQLGRMSTVPQMGAQNSSPLTLPSLQPGLSTGTGFNPWKPRLTLSGGSSGSAFP